MKFLQIIALVPLLYSILTNGIIATISLRISLYLIAWKIISIIQKSQIEGVNKDISTPIRFRIDWKGLVHSPSEVSSTINNDAHSPFITIFLGDLNLKAYIHINDCSITSIRNLFKLMYSSSTELCINELILNASLIIVDQNESTITSVTFSFKTKQASLNIISSRLTRFLIFNPLLRFLRLTFLPPVSTSSERSYQQQHKKFQNCLTVIDYLKHINVSGVSLCIVCENITAKQSECSNLGTRKLTNRIIYFFVIPRISIQIFQESNHHGADFSSTNDSQYQYESLGSISNSVEGFAFQMKSVSDIETSENDSQFFKIDKMTEEILKNSSQIKVPLLILNIDIINNFLRGQNTESTVHEYIHEPSLKKENLSWKIDVNTFQNKKSERGRAESGESIQVTLDIIEATEIYVSLKRIFNASTYIYDQMHKNSESDDETSTTSPHGIRESIGHTGNEKQEQTFPSTKLSFKFGFILTTRDNINSSDKYENPNSYPIWKIGMDRCFITHSFYNRIIQNDRNKCESSCVTDIYVRNLFLNFCEEKEFRHKMLQILQLSYINLNSIYEVAKSLRVSGDMSDTMLISHVRELEIVADTLHKIQTRVKAYLLKTPFFRQPNRRKKQPSILSRSYDLIFHSVNLYYMHIPEPTANPKKAPQKALPITLLIQIYRITSSFSSNNFEPITKRVTSNFQKISIAISSDLSSIFDEIQYSPPSNESNQVEHRTTFLMTMVGFSFSHTFPLGFNLQSRYSCSIKDFTLEESFGIFFLIDSSEIENTTLFLKKIECLKNETVFKPCIVSRGMEFSIIPDHIYSQGKRLDIITKPTEITWSLALHISILAALKSIVTSFQYAYHIYHKKSDSTKKQSKRLPLQATLKGEDIVLNARLGESSFANAITEKVEIRFSLNIPGLSDKRNISLSLGKTQISLDSCYPPFLIFDHLFYYDKFYFATTEELISYQRKHESKDLCSLSSNKNGAPLKESIEMKAGKAKVILSPDLYFGRFIKDLLLTPKVLNRALEIVGYRKQKYDKKDFQLMVIQMSMIGLDLIFLEQNQGLSQPSQSSLKSESFTHFYKTSNTPIEFDQFLNELDENNKYVHLLKVYLNGINIKIERNTPPSITQNHIRKLDDGQEIQLSYGPVVQGGFVTSSFQDCIFVLDPLNLVSPLGMIREWKWDGNLYLTELSPDTPNLAQGTHFFTTFGCFHSAASQSVQKHKFYDFCRYKVQLHSRDVPTKVYYEGSMRMKLMSVSYGPVLKDSVQRLLHIFQRLQMPKRGKTSPPLGWWDNLRFMFHGKLKFVSESISFCWLLDSVDLDDLSLSIKCRKFNLSYSIGMFKVSLHDFLISLPNIPYPLHHQDYERLISRIFADKNYSYDDRQPLLWIPVLHLHLDYIWVIKSSILRGHHCPYIIFEPPDLYANNNVHDKLHGFRSSGVELELKVTMSGDESISNWFAVRVETLPWITHNRIRNLVEKANFVGKENNPEDPGPLPIRKQILVRINAYDTRVALWYGSFNTSGLCMKLSAIHASFHALRECF